MPGNPFKPAFRGGNTRAAPRRPSTPNARKTYVPTPVTPNGISSRSISQPATGTVRVTTKARRSLPMPAVPQGAQEGTPGKIGSRPGAKPW